jgi:hypothetical protein
LATNDIQKVCQMARRLLDLKKRALLRNTRLKITSFLTRVHISICTQGSKCLINCGESLNNGHKKACNYAAGQGCRARLLGKAAGQDSQARLPGKAAVKGCRERLPGKAAGQGCRARLPGKAAGQGCRARLPGKTAGQDCRARLPGKAEGQGCRARLSGKAACNANGAIC